MKVQKLAKRYQSGIDAETGNPIYSNSYESDYYYPGCREFEYYSAAADERKDVVVGVRTWIRMNGKSEIVETKYF